MMQPGRFHTSQSQRRKRPTAYDVARLAGVPQSVGGLCGCEVPYLFFVPGPSGDPGPALDEVLRFQVEAVILASTRLTSQFIESSS